MKRIVINSYLLVVLLSLLQGCGYQTPYARSIKEQIPPTNIHLTIWANQTNELGIENLIYQRIADWLQQSRQINLTDDKEQADYLLTGTVLSVNYPATAFTVTDTAATLKATVRTSYQLLKKSSGSKVWEVKASVREQYYDAGADSLRSQSNKKTALTIIADEVAEQIYLRTIDTIIAENKK